MKKPYIGITDFASEKQVRKLADHLARLQRGMPAEIQRTLMVGIMMKYETLHDLPTSWAGKWVPKERLPEVFIDYPGIYNTLHYADYKNQTTFADLEMAVRYAGPHLHAVQLDMTWPGITLVSLLRETFPDIDIVLQVGTRALRKSESKQHTPTELVSLLRPYEDFIEFVLLDESSGTGRDMDPLALMWYLDNIVDELDVRVAAAGGIGPWSTEHVASLLHWHPYLSVDAQGRLRPSGSSKDPMDVMYGLKYLSEMVGRIRAANAQVI